jgi:uncharacterized protein YrrD
MLRSLKDLLGFDIQAADGKVGQMVDVLFDDEEWQIRYFVVDVSDWLEREHVLISTHAIQSSEWETGSLSAALTRDQVKSSPSLSAEERMSRQQETELLTHYDWPIYWAGYHSTRSPATTGVFPDDPGVQPDEKLQAGSNVRSFDRARGYGIRARDGDIGHLDDLVVSDETWLVQYLVIDTGSWLSGKKVVLAPAWTEQISWDEQVIVLDLAQETVEQSPEYDPSALLGPAGSEASFHERYGLSGGQRGTEK